MDTRNKKLLLKKMADLDLDRLQQVLDYNPETGVFTWRVMLSPRGTVGSVAGTIMPKGGYRRIAIDRVSYPAHHLAWFHFYGEPTDHELDFINVDPSDCRISNLRPSTHTQNCQNRGRNSKNSTGYKGVDRFNNKITKQKGYRAQIRVNGKRLFLGLFDTPEKAYQAYCAAAKKHHGEFARLE